MAPTSSIRWFAFPARLILAGLFIFAAALKLRDPQMFADAIRGFKILPDHLVTLTAFVIPWTELLAGVLLAIGLWARGAALVLVTMLAAFVAGVASILVRGMEVKCSCFGSFELVCTGAVGWCQIIRNIVMIALGVLVLAMGPGPISFDRKAA
jgi:uncharacterized membrane protein YphA (DoxX/SURF4 family)